MNKRQKIVQQAFLDDEEKVINKLKNQYSHSLKEITKKAENLQKDIERLDTLAKLSVDEEEKEKILSQRRSKVYQKQYQDSLKKQVSDILDNMQENEFTTVADYLDKCYEQGFLGTMYDLQGQGIPLCFPLDQEAMVRAVQLDSKISQGLYSRLGEDVSVLKKKITAQVSRGISTGMTFPQIAQQLAGVTNIGFNNAVRIARTEGHRIQVQSGMDACYKAKEKGADVVKQWDSTMDGVTRESHVAVDGEIRDLDEKFSNGLRFPGDPHGMAREVVNCRCALLQRARWDLSDEEFTKMNGETGELMHFKDVNDYNEFKKEFFKQSKVVETKQGFQKKAPTKPVESDNSSKTYTKKQLDGMNLAELRKTAEETALKYYESGISGISFGNANMKDVARSLAKQGSATSLKKDIMAMQKKMKSTNVLTKSSKSGITKMSNKEVRQWYVENVSKIAEGIDEALPIEEKARQAFEARNKIRTEARNKMADEKSRALLDAEKPNKTFEELIESKMKRKGMTREEAIEDIYKTATKTNADINKELGLDGD